MQRQAINILLGVTEFFTQDLGDFFNPQPFAFELKNLSFQSILANTG